MYIYKHVLLWKLFAHVIVDLIYFTSWSAVPWSSASKRLSSCPYTNQLGNSICSCQCSGITVRPDFKRSIYQIVESICQPLFYPIIKFPQLPPPPFSARGVISVTLRHWQVILDYIDFTSAVITYDEIVFVVHT